MEYDIKNHLGQQIENFLNAFAGADVPAMERIKGTIMDIYNQVDDGTVVMSIRSWDKKKQEEIQRIWAKAQESLKTIATAKNNEKLFIDIDEMKNDAVKALNEIESSYWTSIRGLFLKSVKE